MAPQDTESQFKFLLACIKHSANGKINFEAVAGDLGIVSKAAAAKRYERLLKAHDIVLTPRGHGDGGGRARAPPKAPKTPRSTTRKRKPTRDDDEDEDGLDIKEEEDGGSPTKKSKVVSALDDDSDEEFAA